MVKSHFLDWKNMRNTLNMGSKSYNNGSIGNKDCFGHSPAMIYVSLRLTIWQLMLLLPLKTIEAGTASNMDYMRDTRKACIGWLNSFFIYRHLYLNFQLPSLVGKKSCSFYMDSYKPSYSWKISTWLIFTSCLTFHFYKYYKPDKYFYHFKFGKS